MEKLNISKSVSGVDRTKNGKESKIFSIGLVVNYMYTWLS